MLQVGGEQEAVTDPPPGSGVESEQDCWHPALTFRTPGCEALQVKGILLRTMPPVVLGRELFPMMSVTTAVAFCAVPFEVTKVVSSVCCDPLTPTSRETVWMGQVSKKSRTGEVVPSEFLYCGCWKEELETPLADA